VTDWLLVVVVAVALVFDFTNGFHDTANAVATSVSTRALPPRIAVLVAAVMNFLGALASTAVATTVGQGIVDTTVITGRDGQRVVLAALIGAIAWNVATWWIGLPSSSSHALIGGLVGASIAAAGVSAVQWGQLVHKVIEPAILAPLLGFAGAFLLMLAVLRVFARTRPAPLNRGFRAAQVVSGSLLALTHGANDAQKTMGVISLALLSAGRIDHFYVPTWVVVTAASAIAIGTYAAGWRIVRTLGSRVFKLEPPHGFAAQSAATAVLYTTARLGFPVSTTQVITGSVMGVGATRRLSAVRWGVAGDIVSAWLLTVPAAAIAAAVVYAFIALG
jgi:PiT family inorganic phosphate transporter